MTTSDEVAAQATVLGRMMRDYCPVEQLNASLPTRFLPGDPRKIPVLEKRIEFGFPLRHPQDAEMPYRWYWGDNQRGDNGRDVQQTLYDAAGNVVLVKRLEGTQWEITELNDYGDLRPKTTSRPRNSA